MNDPRSIHEDALAIWQAGVEAVRSDRLVRDHLRVAGDALEIGDLRLPLDGVRRIAVVGCGKAGAGMAAGVEAALGERLMRDKQLTGWVNVPADCVRPLSRIHLHPARPAGVNEPTEAGVAGAARILELVGSLQAGDLCLCLISGGGSALLPAPVEGVALAEKQAITRFLSGAGANIRELNTVRKQLSRIKGGGLARACTAGRLVALIISDVLGDPLDIIASGPTVPDPATPRDALAVLDRFGARQAGVADAAIAVLEQAAAHASQRRMDAHVRPVVPRCQVTNLVIGNNATAVAAAGEEARRRGYRTTLEAATVLEGDAEAVGRKLAESAAEMLAVAEPQCLISGGEPTVTLAPADRRGQGGRNQQLVLAAFQELSARPTCRDLENLVLLSGGTDGEDGPTDAAGAFLDAATAARARQLALDPHDFLARNDAYHFFQPLAALLLTGPTHTNVCDLRVVLRGLPSLNKKCKTAGQ